MQMFNTVTVLQYMLMECYFLFKNKILNFIPYIMIYFLTSLLEYNCFTMLCQFLLYNKVHQLYVYIDPHISSLMISYTNYFLFLFFRLMPAFKEGRLCHFYILVLFKTHPDVSMGSVRSGRVPMAAPQRQQIIYRCSIAPCYSLCEINRICFNTIISPWSKLRYRKIVIQEDTNRASSPESKCSASTHWQFQLM